MRDHWPAIEAVAKALVRRRVLDRWTLEALVAAEVEAREDPLPRRSGAR